MAIKKKISRASKKAKPKVSPPNKGPKEKKIAAPLPKGIEGAVIATEMVVKTNEKKNAGPRVGVCFSYNRHASGTLKVSTEINGKLETIKLTNALPIGVKEPKEGSKITFRIVKTNGHYEAQLLDVLSEDTAYYKAIKEMRRNTFGRMIGIPMGHLNNILGKTGNILANFPEGMSTADYVDQIVTTLNAQKGFQDYNLVLEGTVNLAGQEWVIFYDKFEDGQTTDNGDAATGNNG